MWQGIKNYIHLLQAIAANVFYGFPFRGLTIIGVTGTDGKTTTASLIYHILQKSGKKAALVTSVSAIIDGKSSDIGFHVTTPRFFALRSYMKRAKQKGATYFVLETTSHAIDQNRVFGIPFAVAVLTNITREHLDYHKTYERYVQVKARLLRCAKVAVVNKDDRSYMRINNHELRSKERRVITYGLKRDSEVNPHSFPFQTKLLGQFNKYNCLAAIAVTRELHLPEQHIRNAVASFKAPIGREEIVYDKDFTVIIDFAHTPNAFAQLLPEVKKAAGNRLIHVFGSAAKRDMYKRPEMGNLSAEYADVIVLTAEDPRNEGVEKITEDILRGIKLSNVEVIEYASIKNQDAFIQAKKKYIIKVPDRKEAIICAIGIAQKGDTVLLTGKGHERSMNYGHGEEPWSEHEAVKEALRLKSGKLI